MTAKKQTLTQAMTKKPGTVEVEGVRITHPEHVIDASTGHTKLDLARYYASIAEFMLPHMKSRPASLVHAPVGAAPPRHGQGLLAPHRPAPRADDPAALRRREKAFQSHRQALRRRPAQRLRPPPRSRRARDRPSFQKADPWVDYWTCKQTLTAAMKALADVTP